MCKNVLGLFNIIKWEKMDNVVSPGWLDYGTLGLLAAVLVAFGYGVYAYFKNTFKQMNEQSASMVKQVDAQSAFVRSLAEQSIKSQQDHMEAWKQMTRDTLSTFKSFSDAISDLQEALKTETRSLHEDHNDIKSQVRGLIKEKL